MSLLVLLNLSAFDAVNHGILLEMLLWLGVGGLALAWLRSFLKDCPQIVQLGEMDSTLWTLNSRIPPRLIISTMLFNSYIRPLGEVIRRSVVLCHQYTHDTQLYTSFQPSSVDAAPSLEHCLAGILGWEKQTASEPRQGRGHPGNCPICLWIGCLPLFWRS